MSPEADLVITLRPSRRGFFFAAWGSDELLSWPSRQAHLEAASVLHHSRGVAPDKVIAFKHGDGPITLRALLADLIREARSPQTWRSGLTVVSR
ncbi:hypothetical protein ACD578_10575 [Microvirga sp. RSM25]|uniref:hypothetical protein n=1 Tax=Microvirga sp. RSM25 TaxID=3273802 RepID=UPI003850B7A7